MRKVMLPPMIGLIIMASVQIASAITGTDGTYIAEIKMDFYGSNLRDDISGYQFRSSGDHVVGYFSLDSSYSGRFGILKSCGNNIVDSGEQCDGTNLNAETCVSRGYSGGTLKCKTDCTFDPSACTSTTGITEPTVIGGAAGHITEISAEQQEGRGVYTLNVAGGELKYFTTGKSAQFTLKEKVYILDVKEVTESAVKVWVLHLNKTGGLETQVTKELNNTGHVSIDLDKDKINDLLIELKGIIPSVQPELPGYKALLYLKEIIKELPGEAKTEAIKEIQEVSEIEKPQEPEIKTRKDKNARLTTIIKQAERKAVGLLKRIKTDRTWQIASIATAATILLFLVIRIARKNKTEK